MSIETGNSIFTWAVGHILQQAAPARYNPKFKHSIIHWNYAQEDKRQYSGSKGFVD